MDTFEASVTHLIAQVAPNKFSNNKEKHASAAAVYTDKKHKTQEKIEKYIPTHFLLPFLENIILYRYIYIYYRHY